MRRFSMRELLPFSARALSADARTALSSSRCAAPSDRFHSFDSGATVALIGNAVGYVGPMIAHPLFQSAMLTSSGIFFQR
jgi:hypothetical protein